MTDIPTCRRCGAKLGGSYSTDLVSAQQLHGALAQDGALLVSTVLRATSACSWNCLAVLAAIEAGGDGDAAVQVVAERERQVTAEGWSPEHDDTHDPGNMAAAGVCYAANAMRGMPAPEGYTVAVEGDATPYVRIRHGDPELSIVWPWGPEWWKPKDRLRDLVRAGALIAAEADRDVRAKRSERAGRF